MEQKGSGWSWHLLLMACLLIVTWGYTVAHPLDLTPRAYLPLVMHYKQALADFTAEPTSGIGSLTTAFSNNSSGSFSASLWDFGDGNTSTQFSPSHTYNSSGKFTVSLTVSGLGGTNTLARPDYITVYRPVQAEFQASQTSGVAPLTVNFTNTSIGDYTNSLWDFGDGGSSTRTNPTHTYTTAGEHTVTLTVNGPGGSDSHSQPINVSGYEVRALWVTRFDWTTFGQPADPDKIDEIVQNAAAAGFNAIYFQVRGAADAYYAPGLEPWAQRVSGGQLGQTPNPWWDPLDYLINAAHAQGIQLHAYINVYPVWDNCSTAPPNTTPTHFYYLLQDEHGATGDKPNGLQWDTSEDIHCSVYQRSSPASVFADNHFLDVAADLVTRYDIDGLHLDNIRYGGSNTSCDPVSEASYGASCFGYNGSINYAEWQRMQVNGTVWKFYNQVAPLKPGLWLSAAVWPIHIEKPEWGWGGTAQQGYYNYYQDSKAWIAGEYIDSISPMIYPSTYNCPDDSFWTQERWQTLAADFQADSGSRYIIPGIGAGYCNFDEIAARIEAARTIGVAGYAIFSYGGLNQKDYWDEFVAPGGPHVEPAPASP